MNKRSEKIYSRIDSIAKKGLIGRIEYYSYVDTLLNDGSYPMFQDILIRKYNIDTIYISTIDEVKRRTFDQIRFQTNSKIQEDFNKLYEQLGVIHLGQSIIRKIDGLKIGYIVELCDGTLRVYRSDLYNIYVDDSTKTLLEKYSTSIEYLLETTESNYVDNYSDNYFY